VPASRATCTSSPDVYPEDITEEFTAFVQTLEVGQAKPGCLRDRLQRPGPGQVA
jgi:hypothetical protein